MAKKHSSKYQKTKDPEQGIPINLPDCFFKDLTEGGRSLFIYYIQKFAKNIYKAASRREELERAGSVREIAPAHIKKAYQSLYGSGGMISRRTILKIASIRAVQCVLAAMVGFGFGNYKETWGLLLSVFCVIGIAILIWVEEYIKGAI